MTMTVRVIQVVTDIATPTVADTVRIALVQDPQGPWLILFGILNLIVLGISALLIYRQLTLFNRQIGLYRVETQLYHKEITATHDWNRRKTAHDLIFEASTGPLNSLRSQLEARIGERIWDPGETFATLDPPLTGDECRTLEAILNYFENVSLAVKNHIVDEDIAFDCLAGVIIAYWRWAEPYVRRCRGISPTFWIQIDVLSHTWSAKKADMMTRLVADGKEKL